MLTLNILPQIRKLSTAHCYNCIEWKNGKCASLEVLEAKKHLSWLENWEPTASSVCEMHEWEPI